MKRIRACAVAAEADAMALLARRGTVADSSVLLSHAAVELATGLR